MSANVLYCFATLPQLTTTEILLTTNRHLLIKINKQQTHHRITKQEKVLHDHIILLVTLLLTLCSFTTHQPRAQRITP